MSYRDYLGNHSDLVVHTSDVDSRASGVAVGRLAVWPPRSVRAEDVVSVIEESGLDVVIVRGSPEDAELAAALNTETFISWQADTLLYFVSTTQSLASGTRPDGLVKMAPSDRWDADVLIGRVFKDYKNHYSSNPVLRKIDVARAYQDWTRTALGRTGSAVFKALDAKGTPTGICVTDLDDESYAEILLAGIVPEKRGQGAYPKMIRMVAASAQAANKDSVVISTQASNLGVVRAWCRLGFLPTITLNTFHVVRRDVHRSALAKK